ncbi:dihydrodipicolinate reductase [Oceanicola sp. S124]|uniref:dihydrodipicolinate reductase n=1 Tax=Oceanicola sp. S124 TaxID=1042378 RepID=UPI0002D9D0AF|nr:dihydrodipicolinate reductase [Oceanicola sp. S124]
MCPKTNRLPPVTGAASASLALALALTVATPAEAQELRRVETRSDFLDLVGEASLTRLGMTLQVRPDGSITGRAYGTRLRGSWDWSDTYFCSALTYGGRSHPRNCHTVTVISQTLRMTGDEGQGGSSDFWLRR